MSSSKMIATKHDILLQTACIYNGIAIRYVYTINILLTVKIAFEVEEPSIENYLEIIRVRFFFHRPCNLGLFGGMSSSESAPPKKKKCIFSPMCAAFRCLLF